MNQPTNQPTNSLKTAHNTDFFGEKLAKLRQILPEIFSENTLDLEKLKTLLGDHLAQNERYGLNWVGKSDAYQALQRPTSNTLIPCPAESVDFDTTQNIFIESDNLEALKILQKSYAGKIKMIYIDPPYNTGNDFIYHDDFSQSKKEYEIATGDRDVNGNLLKSFKKNSKDNGHYHSNWLNMMLPRLHLARTLLADDGVIFISIDDNEQAQLKLLCDEIFGEENFVELFVWDKKNSAKGVPPKNMVVNVHEYIFCYARSSHSKLIGELRTLDSFSNPDNDIRGAWRLSNIKSTIENAKNQFTIIDPKTGISYENCWAFSQDTLLKMIDENRIIFPKNSDGLPKQKEFFSEFKNPYIPIMSNLGRFDAQSTSEKKVDKLMENKVFLYKKPIDLIRKIIMQTDKNSIILDFFAGSATTAHAVMQLNAEDNGNRQFIMVQLPELTDEKSEAYKAGFKTISDISKERIRRAGAKIKEQNPDKMLDTGFKVFKLAPSNFKAWQIDNDDIAKQLELYIDPLKDNANKIDIVYELLLRMGLKLTADIHFENGIYWLTCDNKSYAIVLNQITQDDFNVIITKKPAKTVVLDKAFLNDSQRTNVLLQFKDAGLAIESV